MLPPLQPAPAYATLKRNLLLLLPALAILLTALWSALGQVSFLRDPTSPQDWRSAARHVHQIIATPDETPSSSAPHLLPPDRILVWPAWRETPLPELVEVSQSLMWNDRPVLEDLQGAERLFLLAPTEQLDDALDALPYPARQHITSRHAFDTVQVVALEVPQNTTQWAVQLSDLLSEARIEVVTAGETPRRASCSATKRVGDRAPTWRCPGTAEQVGVSFYELDDQPRHCILAHPPSNPNESLRITFTPPALATPSPVTLRVRAGFDLRGARLAQRNDELDLTISIGDSELSHRRYHAQSSTWESHDIESKQLVDMSEGLTFEIAAKDAKHKLFCFNAWLGARPAPFKP